MTQMSTDTPNEYEAETREGSRVRYELVLNLVRERTAVDEDMPPTISSFDLLGRLRHRGVPHDYAKTAIRAALDNDELVAFESADGRRQLVTLAEPEHIRRAIADKADREHPRQDVIGYLNQVLQEVRDADDDE